MASNLYPEAGEKGLILPGSGGNVEVMSPVSTAGRIGKVILNAAVGMASDFRANHCDCGKGTITARLILEGIRGARHRGFPPVNRGVAELASTPNLVKQVFSDTADDIEKEIDKAVEAANAQATKWIQEMLNKFGLMLRHGSGKMDSSGAREVGKVVIRCQKKPVSMCARGSGRSEVYFVARIRYKGLYFIAQLRLDFAIRWEFLKYGGSRSFQHVRPHPVRKNYPMGGSSSPADPEPCRMSGEECGPGASAAVRFQDPTLDTRELGLMFGGLERSVLEKALLDGLWAGTLQPGRVEWVRSMRAGRRNG